MSFTFGSESSTSGFLMPSYFLSQAGIDPDHDFKREVNFSGSHDKTWALVESGAFQAGVLSEAVWDQAVAKGRVDTDRVREFYTTPAYFDYNWTVRGDVDQRFGPGFTKRIQQALLALNQSHADILDLFSAEAFIESANENYSAIEEVAKSLGIIAR
jgi:phosphonate transport system substrate-binding protein